MTAAEVLLAAVALSLVAYGITAGADFGAGAWDLLASGPRAQRQRTLVENAIAPIWEANHIWMIVAIVLIFTGFPHAFAAITIALHIPISLALVGIVLRGAAFVFRAYGLEPTATRRRWGHVFAWASLVTPVFLGMTLAALCSGAIVLHGNRVVSGFFAGWTSPFAVLVGAFALVLFAMLAATYLTVDAAGDPEVQADFRRRALAAELVAGALAALVAWRASIDAPELFGHLVHSGWSVPVQVATAASAVAAIAALVQRRFQLARIAAAAQVGLVLVGWALAMDGHLVLPAIPIAEGGAHTEVVKPVLWVLAIGGVLLAPALWWLIRVFKAGRG